MCYYIDKLILRLVLLSLLGPVQIGVVLRRSHHHFGAVVDERDVYYYPHNYEEVGNGCEEEGPGYEVAAVSRVVHYEVDDGHDHCDEQQDQQQNKDHREVRFEIIIGANEVAIDTLHDEIEAEYDGCNHDAAGQRETAEEPRLFVFFFLFLLFFEGFLLLLLLFEQLVLFFRCTALVIIVSHCF